ncbi:MAG: hypothetical protein AAFV33_23340 [Chloroflexota bacterium]
MERRNESAQAARQRIFEWLQSQCGTVDGFRYDMVLEDEVVITIFCADEDNSIEGYSIAGMPLLKADFITLYRVLDDNEVWF